MQYIPYIYSAIISLIALIITCADKSAAKHDKRRIPEKTLFSVAIIGGSLAMYYTMRIIRHKTKHKRFMIGLPIIMILQIAIPIVLILLI
ncbi:MAG: DUF1294 domain-containing protein [Clostridia bacterium]|nr:DUF1294 domain-containing protein [Clostridia bacterium]